ncbi:hypothetical protein KZZ52_21500 [Dactylosporangium sp. AC04546]|uniref:hypothetical protein n=1 Tax=Dactylosporangium sp. AC04546 TaxID=2862460 RepID=UPI001EE0091A|nr:hypothetical protein [Dactylosporangium sp. AC04546]WVK87858.1 hypothetical protein KZZ52_21500 [Dactylosporangium sp. AC04546]
MNPLLGVDRAGWEGLHHAYGTAQDVPGHLRSLLSADAGERLHARQALATSVYHQGTRWEASQAVVPWLVALVDDAATPERGSVLALLDAVAIGDRRDDQLPFDAAAAFAREATAGEARWFAGLDEWSDEDIEIGDRAAVRWAADSYRRTAEHLDAVVRWVADPDDDVAARAAALLAWFPPTAAATRALVQVPAGRVDVRRSADLALAHSTDPDPAVDARLRELLPGFTAAVALAYRRGDALPDAALAVLVDDADAALPAAVCGWERAPRGFVMLALQRLGLG